MEPCSSRQETQKITSEQWKKGPWLVRLYRGWKSYPIIGIIISHYKDPYKPTSTMESNKGFFSWLILCSSQLPWFFSCLASRSRGYIYQKAGVFWSYPNMRLMLYADTLKRPCRRNKSLIRRVWFFSTIAVILRKAQNPCRRQNNFLINSFPLDHTFIKSSQNELEAFKHHLPLKLVTFVPTLCAMERILLERLGIGWNDSVAEANEKRMKDRGVGNIPTLQHKEVI